jgi:putative membrane protein
MAAQDTPEADQLDDAQIAGPRSGVRSGRGGHRRQGELASGPAWELAQRLTVDNSARDQKLEALAGPNQQSASNGVAGGGAAGGDLANLSGDALDKAYVDREVRQHQAMLDALDSQLIPSAKSEELQGQLVDLRAATQLQEAQMAQHAENTREIEAQQPDLDWGP